MFPGEEHVREYPDEPEHEHYAQDTIDEGVARYKLAALLVPGRDVLDIACGSGYGPETFAAAGARSVTAIDFDPEAIAYCKSHFRRSRVTYAVMDGRRTTFSRESFDVVVDHGSMQFNRPPEQAAQLAEAERLLKRDGVRVFSMNYNTYTGPDTTKANPNHIWAFDRPGLEGLFRRYFWHSRVVVQYRTRFYADPLPAGTSWIVYASNDRDAFGDMERTLAPYLQGSRKTVDLSPTWRDAL